MANDCDFVLRASGKKKDLRKFAQWMGAYYHYPYDEKNSKYDEKNIIVLFKVFEKWLMVF